MEWLGKRLLKHITNAVYPELCTVCGRKLLNGENVLCLHCRLDIPTVSIPDFTFNEIHRRLAPAPPVDKAVAWFRYTRKDPYVKLIHAAKYSGRPVIFETLGAEMAKDASARRFFDDIDVIQPVPIHWVKRMKRGYNQTEWLARGISQATGIPVCDALCVKRWHASQTHRTRTERWLNARDSYSVADAAELTGKHLLLVDDVITTGATLKACAQTLYNNVNGLKLSILTLAITEES